MKLYITCVAKNIESSFINFTQTILPILSKIDSILFIYENNSTDKTKEMLELLKNTLKNKMVLITEDLTDEYLLDNTYGRTYDNKPCRPECISRARNIVLDAMEKYPVPDFILALDPDIPQSLDPDNILSHIQNFPENVDALFANGLAQSMKYYDDFAYRDSTYPLGSDIVGEKGLYNEKLTYSQRVIQFNQEPIPVYSAFAGMAIYRGSQVRGLRYSAVPTPDYCAFIQKFLKEHPENHYVKKYEEIKKLTHIDGVCQGFYLFGKDKIFFRNSSGYAFPILCEHVTYNASLIMKGHNRLFISPSLIYISDHWA